MKTVSRTVTGVWTALVLVGCTSGTVAGWRSDRDLQRYGIRAHVRVVSFQENKRAASSVRVRMPDGSIAKIGTYGRMRAGDEVEVVYWPDDQAHAEFPGWPNGAAIAGLVLGVLVDLIAGAVLYGLVVPPIVRRRRRARRAPGEPA